MHFQWQKIIKFIFYCMSIKGHLRILLQCDHFPHSKTQTEETASTSHGGNGKREQSMSWLLRPLQGSLNYMDKVNLMATSEFHRLRSLILP